MLRAAVPGAKAGGVTSLRAGGGPGRALAEVGAEGQNSGEELGTVV